MLIATFLIGIVVCATVAVALAKHRDTFHPAVLIGPMLAFHYCYSPLVLEANDGFYGFLWESHVARAQWIHLVGVLALCTGLLLGSRERAAAGSTASAFPEVLDRPTLVRGSIVLGLIGVASFAYGITYVGGFTQAYGRAYGGGYAESGWIRDLVLFCLPALLLLTISHYGRPITWREVAAVVMFASPLLIHGLLGARRGPTFMGLAGPAMVFYMARGRRPRLPTMVVGGACLGFLMLGLVANRETVYWGTELAMEEGPSKYFRPGTGNDFIYGAGLVVVADETQDFGWGATYVTTLLVRPIPRFLWPTKYEDAAAFFGRPMLVENLGVDVTSFQNVLGWTAAIGAAPGIVGDMWREFSWAMIIVLLGLGWFYGSAWRKAVTLGGSWVPIYCFLASLSLYLIMQTLEAMLYRFLFGVAPMLLVLRLARRSSGRAAQAVDPRRTAPI